MAKSSLEEYYFKGFQDWDELKFVFMGFHLIVTFVTPPLLLSIIWYENYGCDAHHRTVVNILLSHICWAQLTRSFFARIPNGVVIMIVWPVSRYFCEAAIFVSRFYYLFMIMEILLWQVMKYIYIFHWKNAVNLNDEFIACFLTATNIMMCCIVTTATQIMGLHTIQEEFHICIGKNPSFTINQRAFLRQSVTNLKNPLHELAKTDINGCLNHFVWLCMVLITLRIWIFSRKHVLKKIFETIMIRRSSSATNPLPQQAFEHQNPNAFHATKASLVGAAGSFAAIISFIVLMLPVINARQSFISDVNGINYGRGRTMMYVSRISQLVMNNFLFPLILICSGKKMRSTIWSRVKQGRSEIRNSIN